MQRNISKGLVLVAAAVLVTACESGPDAGVANAPDGAIYDVELTRTTYGVPHLKANDFGSLGYGYGYAFAEDNLCVMQEDLVTIRGERSRYFGGNGTYTIVPNGNTSNNIDSDFFWKMVASEAAIAPIRAKTQPDFKKVTRGFVDGYNRYIRELKTDGHRGRHVACRDSGWLFEITEDDMYRRYFRLAVIASSSVFVSEIANAAPATGAAAKSAGTPERTQAALKQDPGPFRYFTELRGKRFGSNMYALGKDAVAPGQQSMVFGNPHFPWTGPERLYLAHFTLPGKMDIMGVGLHGVPAALIGFNDHFAWSHTVSTAYRFTFFELTLNPSNPYQYLYDGAYRDIEQVPLTIDVRQTNGTLVQQSRTLYRSHYGPMLVLEVNGAPVLGWNSSKAYALRDANAENDRLINQFASWNTATSLDEFIQLHGKILGIPWVNTVASGPDGKAYYGDLSVVPNVPDDMLPTCAAEPLHSALQQLVPGLPVLNGSDSNCEWRTDADAPAPGIFGPSHLPSMQRTDWVANNNDSYWLTNPAQPITGYARIIGDEDTPRSYRTQQAITQLQRRLDGSDGLSATKGFTLPLLQKVVLSARIKTGEYGLANVLAEICPGTSGDAALACAALAQWDGTANLDSTGAHVWREFMAALTAGADRGGDFWRVPYSSVDPVNTPRDLDTSAQAVQDAFATAVTRVKASGFAFDARLGDIQHPCCILRDIPVFGGQFFEGAFTIADSPNLGTSGYNVSYGNSYIQTVTWEREGEGYRPHAEGFVTYSQSTDPASPYFSDFTRAYSAKQWHRFPFRPAEIQAAKILQIRLTNG